MYFKKKKPVILATGASTMQDVKRAVKVIKKYNNQICVMQCNTNYTAENENFNYINLNVLKEYKKNFKNIILGLSDHTHGHSTVLGAISLGAKVIEKHFTLSNKNEGPDHKFSMTPSSWKEMVERARELELSLGSNIKKIEFNERDSIRVQRRSLHLNIDLPKNTKIQKKHLISLRPYLEGSFQPYEINKVIGKRLKKNLQSNQIILKKFLK